MNACDRLGRLASRLWARGTNTTYSYNTAGDLAAVVYSDGTAGVTNTYDRLGRKSSVLCGSTTTSFTYDWANDVLSESYSGGILNGLMVSNQFDADLRRTNLALLNGATVLTRAVYGYDNASRLASVADGNGNSAAYSYLANSPLVGQIVFAQSGMTAMTTTKQYDYLNRLSLISSSPSNSFLYQYNSADQRNLARLADGSYWRYGYDTLGQVTSGKKYWSDMTPVAGQQFDYTFDTIGNRTQTQAGGDQTGANLRVANYANNTLNQITSRDVPGYVDIMGDALATNSVTVNSQTPYRRVEYFRQQLNETNTSAAVWQSVTVASPGQTSVTGNVYVAKTPEAFTYDADGNLLSDGRWTNAWDAENRLVNTTSLTGAPSGSQLQLAFAYDYMGRRIQKIVSTNYSGSYFGEYTNNYAYDGWNCLAILNSSLTTLNSFLWGSDLSGSLQGAGGVGGLLEMSYYGSAATNCFLAFDGNGNVSALVNAANGTTLANYEYGPFGEVIRATGPMAMLNPCRYSTKYEDDETGLVYYGYRYYNPNVGRWLSKDPIEEKGGKNLYCFIGNCPEVYFDSFGLYEVTETATGFDITVGPATYHVGPSGGTAPVNYNVPLTVLSIATGSAKVKGTITLSLLAIHQSECEVSTTPVTSQSDWETHLWPFPPSVSYSAETSAGEASKNSTKGEAEISFPDIVISISNSGTSTHRKWGVKCGMCLQGKATVNGSFNITIDYVMPLAVAAGFLESAESSAADGVAGALQPALIPSF